MKQQFARLNEVFYSSSPAEHFRNRLSYLMLAATRGSELRDLLVGSRIQLGELELVPGESDFQGLGDYVTTESHALLHHASESLLRLFLAHRDQPPCPWVEVVKESDFKAFKRKLAALAGKSWSAEMEESLLPIFLGRTDAADEELIAARAAIKRLLRILAARLLEDATLYNSVKHGFAARAATHTLTVGDDSDEGRFTQTGETVTFLEFKRLEEGRRRWQTTTTWMSPEYALGLASLAITEIEALWEVARSRYLGIPADLIPCVNGAVLDAVEGIPRGFAPRLTEYRFEEDSRHE